MKPLNSVEIREKFLKFFKDNDHQIIAGSSVVPKNDPTLLFINSGMAPLKKYFLGEATPPHPRLANVQPCIRTKDIDDVGDRHHLTIFEMLGSWSIGDYYKKKAVELAYDLLVNHLKFDPRKLYVTVYQGNPKLGLPPDNTSARAWQDVGIASDHIIALGQDNFWGPAGDTGPCGPCTEVFFDFGDQFGPAYVPGDEFVTTSRYIEIWNAGVFMEFNKLSSGEFESLPLKSVDTGSGLERMVMAMNQFKTVYETDLLKPFMEVGQELLATSDRKIEVVRMMADHMRAASFIMSEGVAPNNEGQGYIPRRLLRKCIAVTVSHKVKSQNLVEYSQVLAKSLGGFYPHLQKNLNQTRQAIIKEINEFEPILRNGLKILDEKLAKISDGKLGGQDAFEIVATHGVPLEVVKSHCLQRGVQVNDKSFEMYFDEHKKISRHGSAAKNESGASRSTIMVSLSKALTQTPATVFLGYEKLEITEEIVHLFNDQGQATDTIKEGQHFFLVTLKSCFYPESGGQIGDRGVGSNESCHFDIIDAFRIGKVIVHECKMTDRTLHTHDTVQLIVNTPLRLRTRKNHSATHLLNGALRKVLGTHVAQKGSLVDENRLRFDFLHPLPLTPEQIAEIEDLVNRWIWDNFTTEIHERSLQEAANAGAIMLAGEKYGARVRTVTFGDSSFELCGGTHVLSTGEIGLFLITSESSIARGIRRIEAVTGPGALQLVQERGRVLKEACDVLATKQDKLIERIQKLKLSPVKAVVSDGQSLVSKAGLVQINEHGPDFTSYVGQLNSEAKDLKNAADTLLQKHQVVCLIAQENGATRILVMVEKETAKRIKAQDIVNPILASIQGRGGGKETFAQGGGDDSRSASDLVQDAVTLICNILNR